MKRYAVFVDAGYFWVQASHVVFGIREDRSKLRIDYPSLRKSLIGNVESQWGADLLRVYWYDGPSPSGIKTDAHRAIEELDDFKLRLGTRSGSGAQKAVDGLVIADLISLAQAKAISHAMLLSGDADLTPGVMAAQAVGLRVHLLSMGPPQATSPFLAAEADRKCRWEDADVRTFASRQGSGATLAPPPAPRPAVPQPQVALREATVVQADFGAARMAEAALAQFDRAAIEAISKKISSSIPGPIDKRLMALAIEALGRELLPDERVAYRAAIKAHVRENARPDAPNP